MSILASEIDNRVGEQGQGLKGRTSDVERATPRAFELGNRLLCFPSPNDLVALAKVDQGCWHYCVSASSST